MRYYILLFASIISFNLSAQREPLSGMFWNNYAHFNPATSGLIWGHELNVSYRNQWTGLDGAPQTIFANYNTILADKHGFGINYSYDKTGFINSHRGNINYNYQLALKKKNRFSFGFAAGINSLKTTPEWILQFPYGDQIDPVLSEGFNENSFNVNAGIAYSSKRILTGISLTQIAPENVGGIHALATNLHAHFMYTQPLSRKSSLAFGFMGSSDFSFSTLDFTLRYTYLEKIWLGVNYRNHDSFGANITWDFQKKLKKFRIGYNYEFTLSKLSSNNNGTHEIMLGLRIF